MVGKLENVDLREVWRKEAKDFTTWMEKNIDYLNDALDISLTVIERENPVGLFYVDLVAEDSSGQRVAIENQLEKTDHDHLGKLITYLSNLDAKIAIWITSEPKQEHIKAVTWLNERLNKSGFSFYLVKVEAFRIGESEPAPLFSAIVGPSEEAMKIGEEKEEDVERFIKRRQFWSQLLKKCEGRLPLYSNVSPSKDHWLSAGSGRGGIYYNFIVMAKDGGRLELVISRGKDSQEENKRIFDELYSKREEIEKKLGDEITWKRLDNKVSSRLEVRYAFGGLYEEDDWGKLQETMINGMIKFEKTLGPYLKALKL